ncbi:MAG: hypothetical protein WCQ45_03820, partial [bacterium]
MAALILGLTVGALVSRGAIGWESVALVAGFIVLSVLTFRRLEFGLIALLFTLPLDTFGRIITSPVTITAFHVVLMICLAAWSRRIVVDRGSLRFSWMDIAAWSLVAAGLWSLPSSLAFGTTALSVVRLVFLALMAALYANGIRDRAGLRRVIGWFVATGALLSMVGLAQYFLPGFDFGWIRDVKRAFDVVSYSRVGGFFYDPNLFAGLLSSILAVSLSLLTHARHRREAILWGGATVLSVAALVLTFSRG